jgi:hypothetical protein
VAHVRPVGHRLGGAAGARGAEAREEPVRALDGAVTLAEARCPRNGDGGWGRNDLRNHLSDSSGDEIRHLEDLSVELLFLSFAPCAQQNIANLESEQSLKIFPAQHGEKKKHKVDQGIVKNEE